MAELPGIKNVKNIACNQAKSVLRLMQLFLIYLNRNLWIN